jgi:hypothetical protein
MEEVSAPQFIDQRDEALSQRKTIWKSGSFPGSRICTASFHSAFRLSTFQSPAPEISLIQEEIHTKTNRRYRKSPCPPRTLQESERSEQMSQRFPCSDPDRLSVNYYQFSVDFLNLER